VKSHSVEENSNGMIDDVAQILSDLASAYNLAIDTPHHVAKGSAQAGNANAGRGASALTNAVRLAYTLTAMSEDEAEAFGIPKDERKQYVRYDRGKTNTIRGTGPAKWFKLVGVPLGNGNELYPAGDEVQTCETWSPPDTWADLSNDDLNSILTMIDKGTGLPAGCFYSAAPNARARAAWRVIVKHHPKKQEGQAREIIRAWVRTGLLVEEEYSDPTTRKVATGLRVDDIKRPGREA
jgi:hypothetical protein